MVGLLQLSSHLSLRTLSLPSYTPRETSILRRLSNECLPSTLPVAPHPVRCLCPIELKRGRRLCVKLSEPRTPLFQAQELAPTPTPLADRTEAKVGTPPGGSPSAQGPCVPGAL